ncbi:MlaD family protein [Hyalangium rubrum]|uniref:MlaD family protein n=1 Tax=Hyalangium rubrum TaxID=3103134 RepID=A0ABU5H9P5_9BACT|nr:MlaD family protein [Hyalangium sp. s54d21]MDY7230195.1 MlaD family protein [Hyalangium sp. s54d21]
MSLFTSTERERSLAWRAGLFVAGGLVLAAVVVFFIGQQTRLFEKQVTYRAFFPNVEGLTEESPVWIGGLEVGRVVGIAFADNGADHRIEVQIELSEKYANRVREDSIARLSSLGVLGEKAVDITLGDPKLPAMPSGGVLRSGSGGDLNTLMQAAGEIMDDSKAISRSLRVAVEAYSDPQIAADVAGTVRSLRALLEEVEKGDGVLHALVYDKEAGRQVREVMASTAQAAQRIDSAVGHVEALLEEVRKGDGTAHALIYGQEGAKALSELGAAAGQLAGLIEDAKQSPNGAVHQLVYGDARGMFADLGSAAADIKKITSTVASGEGTVGGLISDPTVYEDLRQVLGNVKRNRVLRALVRFSVNNREELDQVGKVKQAPEDATGVGGSGKAK